MRCYSAPSDCKQSPNITRHHNFQELKRKREEDPTEKSNPKLLKVIPWSQPTSLLEAEYNLSRLRFTEAVGMRYNYFVGESKEHGCMKERDREMEECFSGL